MNIPPKAKSNANIPVGKRPNSNQKKKAIPTPKPSFVELFPQFGSDYVRELPLGCCVSKSFGGYRRRTDNTRFLKTELWSGEHRYRGVRGLRPYLYDTWDLSELTQKKILNLMGKQMHNVANGQGWTQVNVISNARTPILKLQHGPSNLSVDVSFTSRLIFQNTGMLTLYSYLDRRVRPLVFALRHWADSKGLTGPNGFTKYALTVLLIFFLCNTDIPVLRPPQQIAELGESRLDLKAFLSPDGTFSFDLTLGGLFALAQWLPQSNNVKSEDDLRVEFFNYFSTFSFRDMVLCGWTGKIIPVEAFQGVQTYEVEDFKLRYINIQDPFDLAHNITRGVDLDTFITLLHYLSDEASTLRNKPLNMVELLERGLECGTLPLPIKITFASVTSTVPYDSWVSNITDLLKSVLEGFFKCECTKNDSALQKSRLIQTGKVVEEFACRLQYETWGHQTRQDIRKILKKNAPHISEWDLECQVGKMLSEHQVEPLNFTITIVNRDNPSVSLGIILTSDEMVPIVLELLQFLSMYLSANKRWFLTMAHSVSALMHHGDNPVLGCMDTAFQGCTTAPPTDLSTTV